MPPEPAQAGDLNLSGVAKCDSAGSEQQVTSDICMAGYPEGICRGSAWVGRIGSVHQLDCGIVQTCRRINSIKKPQSWTVGLHWKGAFAKGNALGMTLGQPIFLPSLENNEGSEGSNDANCAWE